MAVEILSGNLSGDKVILGPNALPDLYNQGYFGRPLGKDLELSFVEAAYLLDRSRIKIFSEGDELDFRALFELASGKEKGFEFKYVVYKDLRERGYYVQPGRPDFRVYPRGGHPGKSPAEFYVLVTSERTPLPLRDILQPIRVAGKMRKRLMLAIVDEESDITFYEAKERSMIGKTKEDQPGGLATLLEDRVMLWDETSSKLLHEHGFYGQIVGGRLSLSLVESAYLMENDLINLSDRMGIPLNLEGFKNTARTIEEDFDLKFRVYKDLREKDLVVKTGFKFGSHFRVYKNVQGLEIIPHSEYLVHAIPKDHVFHLQAVSRAVRLAHSVRKQMVFAYSDDEVRYLEICRLRP
jgi:tRNA-intron endonuclease